MLMKFVACLIFGLIVTGHGEVCAAEKLVLQLPWHHQFQFAGYYMAEEKGYYRDLGFDAEILAVNRTDNPVETVLAGQADFGVSGSGLLIERSLGKPVVAVAAILQQDPTVFLALERSGIRKISDLAGKRVMLAPGGKSLPLIALLHQEKLLDEIELIKTSYDFKSLLNGEADVFNGYSTNEPYLLEELGYSFHIVDPKDYGIHFYGDILFTSEKFLETRPQVVEEFRKASLKGWDYALKHPEETIEVIRSLYHVDKTVQSLQFEAAAIKQSIQPGQIELGTMDRTRWAQNTQHLIASGPLPASFQL